jgi:SNF2 family DNA or RNA helicase
MIVLHAIWNTDKMQLWAESSNLLQSTPQTRGKRGRKQSVTFHPFCLSGHALGELMSILFSLSPGTNDRMRVRLPSDGGMPLSSPWLKLAASTEGPNTDNPHFGEYDVDTIVMTPGEALELLLNLPSVPPHGVAYSGSLSLWMTCARFTLDLVAKGSFAPFLEKEKPVWRTIIDGDDRDMVEDLAEVMPGCCLAFLCLPTDHSRGKEILIRSFLDRTANSVIKGAIVNTDLMPPVPGRPPKLGRAPHQLLKGLCTADSSVDLPISEHIGLQRSMISWLDAVYRIREPPSFRMCFRLEPPFVVDQNALPLEAGAVLASDAEQLEPKAVAAAPEVNSDLWNLRFLLQCVDDLSLIVPVEEAWKAPSKRATILNRKFRNPHENLLTDLGIAAKAAPILERCLREEMPTNLSMTAEEAYSFIKDAAPSLKSQGLGVILPSWWKKSRLGIRLKQKSSINPDVLGTGLFGKNSLSAFDWELALGDKTLSRQEFEELALLKVPLVQVRGEWTLLRPEDAQRALDFFKKRRGPPSMAEALRLALSMNDGEDDEDSEDPTGLSLVGVDCEGWFMNTLESLKRNDSRMVEVEQPKGFSGMLRPYQLKGVSWLEYLRGVGLGACLADDMGLGKTVELIAFLQREKEKESGNGHGAASANGSAETATSAMVDLVESPFNGNGSKDLASSHSTLKDANCSSVKDDSGMKPTLLICPMSVAGNWQREVRRFAPSMKVMVHHGTGRARDEEFESEARKNDLIITTYALANRDEGALARVGWRNVVLDEAQNIKNPRAKQTQAIKRLQADNRIALTGTPVENRLSELWSIMDFLTPGYLGNHETFRSEFSIPIERHSDSNRAAVLSRLIHPFVLRRLKTDRTIIDDLPEKTELKVFYNLTGEQATLYQAVVHEMLGHIELAAGIERKGLVLAALTKLKQICNHPAQFLQDDSSLEGRSGKLIRLQEMLEEVLASGERALIFTQFATMGEMLQRYLSEKLGCEVLFLYGKTSKKQRDAMVDKFQNGGAPLFVLSLKAGGFGLNLTAANHVFHFDRWWNPAVENQATDRAFRIGQRKDVFCHKFVCMGTLEERIDRMIEMKKELAESVIGGGEGWLTEMSNEELREVLLLSREAVLDEA